MGDPMGSVQKINDTVYELFKPPSKPTMQVIFFHGLKRGDYSDAPLSTWTSGDGSGTMWPQTWFVEDFPGAQVLSVSYSSFTLMRRGGIVDSYIIAENLISDLIDARVGRDAQCPVVLVGHSFGGLVMKELCLQAWSRRTDSRLKNFLNNVKGLFFYSTPHHGFPSMEAVTLLLNIHPLQEYVRILNRGAARSHSAFENLRQQYNWSIAGVGEDLQIEHGGSQAFIVVPAISSKYRDFDIAAGTDHFTVCKPTSRISRSFSALRNFVAQKESSGWASIHQVNGVPRYFAGFQKRLLGIQEMLAKYAVVAVVGMSGIGKTAIAKLVFNQISKEFEYTIFVENVKEIPIHALEHTLLSKFYHQGTRVNPEGKMQWSHLQEKKTLIVMDDVDSEDQLKILASLSHFGSESRLIFTTRDQGIVRFYGYERLGVYHVTFLERDEATRLFCHHVFGQESIPEDLIHGLDEYVYEMVNKCSGLPLTIEVVGSYLRDHNSQISFWKGTIVKLTKAESLAGDDRIWGALKPSYDSLSEAEQRMFIDAATYFYEQPLKEALAAWHSAYGSSHGIWENLLDRSMVKEVQRSTRDIFSGRETQYVAVWVHDQLRDLAKALSCRSDVNWLRADTSILRLPSGDQKTHMSLPSDLLNNSERLKYLDLDDVMIKGLLPAFPRKLSLLRWTMRSMRKLPEIHLEEMEDLAVLELANWKVSKKFSKALGNLLNLHILHLYQLEGLARLPENFGNLGRLNRLELVDLGLLMLPDSFGNLRDLEYLALVNVNISALPESFEQLSSLRELLLDGCTQLIGSLEGLARLQALLTLTIRNCERLIALPESLGMLTALEHLSLVNINISALPETFGQLFSLRELVLHGCTQLASLPESLGQLRALQRLTIEDADQVKFLPDCFEMLLALEHLTIRNCQKLRSLPSSFGQLSALEVLVLHGCTQLESLPESLGQQRALQRLTIEDAGKLEALPENLGILSSLKHLTLIGASILTFPESVGELFSLQTLTIQDCEKLTVLPSGLKRLHISERLVIERCVQLERLRSLTIEELSALKDLTVINASNSEFCDSLRMLSALKHLTLINVSIEEFPESFKDLSSLVTLTIRSCLALSSLPQSLGQLSSLEGLYIHNCPKLSSLPDSFVHGLSSLKELYIYDCPVVRDAASEAVVQTYFENRALTADLHIDWTAVSDSSLRTKLKVYRDRNLHLKDVKERLKAPQDEGRPKEAERSEEDDKPTVEDKAGDKAKVEEKAKQESEPKEEEKAQHDSEPDEEDTLEDRIKKEVKDVDMPLTCAKVFLCGYPEVGKTTLRKTLKRCLQEDWWTKFKWERGPNCIPQSRTKGIEIRRIEEKKAGVNMTLNLWDLAGQQDYHVLHGNFFFFAGHGLAGGKATTFVLVFRETFEEGMQDDLLYWLRFVASGSPVKRHVVIVLNHFGLNSDSPEIGRWLFFIDEYKKQFKDRLNIHPDPFIIDVRVASKVKNFQRYLFDQVEKQLHGSKMPRLCHEMQLALKLLPQGKMRKYHPILTWQAFEKGLKLKSAKGEQLSAAAAYLHEMGDIIYFGEQSKEPRYEEKILVVPDPEWFCKEVVGELLLPKNWLERREDQKKKNPERIDISAFKSLFAYRLDQDQGTQPDAVISMLEYLGLCYKISNEELIVPNLSVGDFDYNSNGWEINKGVEEDSRKINWVMGRCLQTFEDKNNTAVPMTLFRRLQVWLAKDADLGGCKSSDYRAGKSFSIFKVDQFMVLVQFDEAANNPNDDRVDVLVKSDVRMDSFARHIDYICKVMQKLQDLCVECCPGVKYDIKVIEPWRATGEDPKMVARNVEVPLTEIRKKVKGDRDCRSTWPRSDLQWKIFLSDSELEELLGFSPEERQMQQDYEGCKRAAVDMGLADFLNELESLSEPKPELPPENVKTELEIQIWEFRQENRALHRKTYNRVGDVISEIRNKHQLLIEKIQATALLSVQQHSVPRYMYLCREDGVWPWINLRKAFGKVSFQLHLLCERHFDKGIAHKVDNQEGITVPVSDEKLLHDAERWARWSLQVLVTVGKTVGNIYLPGVFEFIPDGWPNSNVEKDRTKLLLNKDEGGKLVPDGQGSYGAKDKGIEVGLIAQDVIKSLIESEGQDKPGAFKEKMKLTKVHLQEILDQPSVGPSNKAQPSVFWICFDCHKNYKDRIVDIPA